MSDMDGYQVLHQLRRFPETKDTPVIILTVKKWGEDTEKAIASGAIDYITKPFNPATLMEVIRKTLEHGKENTPR